MNQIRQLFASLSNRQKLTIAIAAITAAAAIYGLLRWHIESDFQPLYSGLAPEDAAAVIGKLKAAAVEFRLAENGTTVLAPSARVPELRLDMAAAGVPRSGRIGYELFDKTNFGATDFTEHINYQRALEGELERSVGGLSAVEQARVHLTFPRDSVFLEARQPAKASVMLKLRPGSKLTPQNVLAVTNLVASAVEGLSPEAVAVMDVRGNLLNRARRPGSPEEQQPNEATLEYRQKVEQDLLQKVNAELEPLLGAEKFRAAVSADVDFSSGEQSEETVDAAKSALLTSQTSEETSGTALASGTPGTASNLPRPAARPGAGGAGMTRRTENLAYQPTRLIRRTRLPQGTLKRVSLSVLVDNEVTYQGTGKARHAVLTPPAPQKLKVIRDVLAGVIGFSAERGDQIVLETLAFEGTAGGLEPALPAAPAPETRAPKWLPTYLQSPQMMILGGVAAAAVLLGIAGALFFLLRRTRGGASSARALSGKHGGGAVDQGQRDQNLQKAMEAQEAEQKALQEQADAAVLQSLRLPVNTTKKADVLIRHVRESVSKDSVSVANVLRTWLSEDPRDIR